MHACSARWLFVAAAGLLAGQGCQHCFSRPACPPAPCPPPVPYVPPAGVPVQPYPPQSPPAPVLQQPVVPPPAPAPTDIRGYSPPSLSVPAQSGWRAPAGGTETQEPPREPVRLQAPEFSPAVPPKPAVTEEKPATPSMPVGIPQFDYVTDQVANGLKPMLDGLDWLKDRSFRTVLHVRAPGEDDSAERRQVEKRGMKFLSLEVSPQTLSQTTVDDFNRIVGDISSYPLFVYDREGSLAGGLWYLHFRTVDKAGDEAARAKAARLGLREGANGDQKAVWLAIQKFLGEQKR
jgi:protein tyrosine phosphatase (PTP) superfamily phosphohydrolase (DUF442 family)